MRLFGLAFLLFAALLLSREYSRYVNKRIDESMGFISFIKYMRLEMRCFLKPPREIGRGFCNDSIAPFLTALESEESLLSAYTVSESAFSLSVDERTVIEELFRSVGVCYAEDGVRLIDGALERLWELYERELSDGRRGVRVFGTVSAAVSVGLFILLI